jgi:hypothetical protein
MLRKIIVLTLIVLLVVPTLVSAQSFSEMTVLDRTAAVEKILYGSEQTGSLVERVSKIEKDMYGAESKDALMVKLDRVYRYVKETSTTSPSFMIKLNAVEWTLSHSVTMQPTKARLENLERVVLGNVASGAFDDRLTKLMKLAFPNGQLEVAGSTLSKDTLVKIKILTPLDTKTSRPGDAVSFQASDDVYSGGVLVIAKGATGLGKVVKVEQAKNFGRDAQLEIAFDTIETIDGTTVETVLGEKAKEETKSLAKAAGATVAGLVILGPFGIVGGAFVHGQDITIPVGTELFVQTKADTELYGVKVR